jgi:uncharacterized protein (DUF488 family)
MRIFTIGFTHKTAEMFFNALRKAGVRRLVDIRLNNTSQLAGFAKKQDLPFLLRELCDADYVHEPLLAPTQEMIDRYRGKKGSLREFRSAYLKLLAARHVADSLDRKLFNKPAVLLCAEVNPEQCHRSFALQYLAKHWPSIEPVHL